MGIDEPHSQTTPAEKEMLAKHAAEANLALEIGVYEGANTVNIAAQIKPNGKLYGIDPFFKGSLGICYHEMIAKNLVKRKGVKNKVHFIPKFSADAAGDIPGNLDYIFIDGDHSFEGFKTDWLIYSEKLRKGGVILLHDTSVPPHDPSVANLGSCQYFQSTVKNDPHFKIIDAVDSLNVLLKM